MDMPIVDQFFAALSPSENPTLTLVVGPVASGKTRYRHEHLAGRAVHLDAGDVHTALGGADSDFPGELEEAMNDVGRQIARRAVGEGYDLVVEIAGDQRATVIPLGEQLRALGWRVQLLAVNADVEVCEVNNENRGPANVPCLYAQPYHLAWLAAAVGGVS